ncbi:MAG: IS1634 family transposase [Acidimicrobiales bacterium]
MHIVTTRRQYKDKEYVAHLLRRSFREDGKVKNETLANLSHLPPEAVEALRKILAGKELVEAGEGWDIERSLPHGHVAAAWAMAHKLGMARLLGPGCAERDLVLALVVARAVRPGSKLATTRWWQGTTMAEDLGLLEVSTDQVYAAMDWLVARQAPIENALARRHLSPGGRVLYDLSSSWVEGSHCPLAKRGHSRDGKMGKAQVEYGLTCDPEGRPVAVEVFAGNTSDPTAFISEAEAVRERFGLADVVMVGDRGMITSARIDALRQVGGLGWLSALRAPQVAALMSSGALQMSLFDEVGFAEISHPGYPGERLVACRNPALAEQRAIKREELLSATEARLAEVKAAVERKERPYRGKDKIALRVGKVVNRYKVAKHFELDIGEEHFSFSRKADQIAAEAALDGIYVVRASALHTEGLSAAELVEGYKDLKVNEAGFRSLKTVDLEVRPIFHWTEARVRAHVFICMLALYLVWHLRRAWAPLCFADEAPPERNGPVAPARRSEAALAKARRQADEAGETLHSFATLLDELATLARGVIVFANGARITKLAVPTPLQRRAFELIGVPVPVELKPM